MKNKSLALFIDAENVSEKYAEAIFENALKYGNIIIRRIYADWSKENVKGWREQIAQYALVAVQQFNFATNKNSSDMSLITDALSIFYEKDIKIFVIVSSDSDFTTLVQKLKENKKKVIGMGRSSSIKSYINSFDKFIYLDELEKTDQTKDKKKSKNEPHRNPLAKKHLQSLKELIKKLIETKNKALYSQIAKEFIKKYPGFKLKNYGFSSFKSLIRELILTTNSQFKEEKENTTYFLVKK